MKQGLMTTVLGIGLALSAWALPSQAEEVTLDHDGTTLWADYTLADGKSAADGVVLMLHGTLAHNRMEIMTTVSELLNEAGFNTLAVNLSYSIDKRAEGMLDCAIEHKHKHEDAVDELALWMDWLKEKGASKVAIWGHSRGGNQVAWYVSEREAAKESDILDKVILVAPATWDAEKSASGYEERYKKPLSDLMATAAKHIEDGKGDKIMDVPGFVYCENAKASATAMQSYYKDDERKNTPTVLKSIDKPVMVVLGSEDDVVKGLPKQLESLGKDNVTSETIDGAGHFFRDLYADEMVELIDEYLAW